MLRPRITSCDECPFGTTSAGRCPFTPTTLPRGRVLLGQAEQSDVVYFVKEGLLSLSSVTQEGGEEPVTLRGPRSFVNLEALNNEPSAYEVRALCDVRVCSLPAEALHYWVGPPRGPARVTIGLLLETAAAAQKDAQWHRGESLARVVRFILTWSSEGQGVPLRKQVVARLLSMRPETLSRCLSKLRRAGLIEPGPRLRPRDRAGLEALLSSSSAQEP